MQRKNIFVSLIIPGLEYPGKNLSVFMQPLVDDLEDSWVNGTQTYDRDTRTNFEMRVWFHYSMHDLPAFALFCGWCTHRKMPCPVCMQALIFIWLKKGGKYSAFDQHRQFLPEGHPFRCDKKNFRKGIAVHDKVDIPVFNGEAVFLTSPLMMLRWSWRDGAS